MIWAAFCLGTWATAGLAQLAEDNPRLSLPGSRLDRSEPLVLVAGHVGVGGSFQYDHGKLNYGGSFLFRPEAAAGFLDALYDLNTGVVLRADYLALGETGRALSADVLLRHYLRRAVPGDGRSLPFVGLGIGATDNNLPPLAVVPDARFWSFVGEAGWEIGLGRKALLITRAQYRFFNSGNTRVSSWAVSCGLGVPVPW